MESIFEKLKFVIGQVAGGDINDGTPVSDAIDVSNAREIIYQSLETSTTGTAVITVEACSAADGTGAEAIAFEKRVIDSAGTPVDALSAKVDVTAAGFTTAVSKSNLYLLRIPRRNLPDTKKFVRVKRTEGVNAAVIGGGIWLVTDFPFSPPAASIVS